MKTWVMMGLVVWVGVTGFAAPEALPWDAELRELGYHIMHTSAINLIYGLELSLEQATELRDLTLKLEQAAQKPPDFTGEFSPELVPVRSAYRDLEGALLAGNEIPKDLEARVMQARAAESKEIKSSLVKNSGGQGCAACHAGPKERARLSPAGDGAGFDPKQVFRAHFLGQYGERGSLNFFRYARETGKILKDEQMAITGNFTCCLVPPQDLKDPMRVGQAAVSEDKMNLLKGVRKVPEGVWPASRQRILATMEQGIAAKKPGITDSARAAELERIGKILDEARSMDEVGFEMEKARLAESLNPKPQDPGQITPEFRAAMFLLLPGNSTVYNRLIAKIKAGEAGSLPRIDLAKIAGADHCEGGQCALKDGGNLK